MGINAILELLKEVISEVVKLRKGPYGIIHKGEPVMINGVSGFLIWDYIIWNEITFEDRDGNQYSLFNSISDNATEKRWNELVERFGV